MTYIELINKFWKLDRLQSFSELDTKLYFFLLNECNIRNWLNPFELQTRNIELSLGVSRKMIQESKKRLKQRGLIDYQSGKKRDAMPVYIILGLNQNNVSCTKINEPGTQTGTQTETQNDTQTETQTGTQIETQNDTQTETQTETLYKTKDKEKEKPPKGGKKKNPSPKELVKSYRESTDNTGYLTLLGWIERNAPYVFEHLDPVTEAQYLRLKDLYGSEAIAGNILKIENRKDLRSRYKSLYLTLKNWCKNEYS